MNTNRPVAAATLSFIGALLLSLTISASAQTPRFQITAYTDHGGGTSSGGIFTVAGTGGQSDAGTTSGGGRFGLSGGFWSILDEPLPRLAIQLQGSQVILSWPNPSTGFLLQEASGLNGATTGWSLVTQPPTVVGSENQVSLPATGFARMFRLYKPDP